MVLPSLMLMRYFPHNKLGLWDKISYSCGVLGKNIAHGLIITLIIFYCTQVLHIHLSHLLFTYLLSLVIECACALILGLIFDNCPNQLRKYKTWILLGTACVIVSSLCFFMLPRMLNNLLEIYLSFVFILFNCCFLLVQLPYLSLISSFSSNAHIRNITATMPSVANFMGRQIIFIGLLSLFTSLKIIKIEAHLYYYLLAAALGILVFSQSIFALCISYHQKNRKPSYSLFGNNNNRRIVTLGRAYDELNLKSYAQKSEQQRQYNPNNNWSNSNAYASLATHPSYNSNVYNSFEGDYADKVSAADEYKSLRNISNDITSSYALSRSNEYQQLASEQSNLASNTQDKTTSQPLDKASNIITATFKAIHNDALDKDTVEPSHQQMHAQAHLESTKAQELENDPKARYQSFNRYNHVQSYEKLTCATNSSASLYSNSATNNSIEPIIPRLKLNTLLHGFLKNDQLMIMFLIAVLQYGNFSLMSSMLSYFFIDNQSLNSLFIALFLVVGNSAQLISMLSFPRLAIGARRIRVFINASIWTGVSFILYSLVQHIDGSLALWVMGFLYMILNICMGLSKVAMTTMVADTVDYGEFKLSLRTDAIVFAYFTSAYRLGTLLSFLIFFADNAYVKLFETVEDFVPLEIETAFETILILLMLAAALMLYKYGYKLNGAFYRNILNNLQFLRQNQRSYEANHIVKQHFMLRYSLDVNAMLIKLKAKNESELIQAMVQKLSEVNAITSEHDYMCDLQNRLSVGPCGIAEGIAIPHAKSSAVKRATVVVATLDSPIDLGALDEQKCDLIFLLASPDDGVTHMNLLGRLSLLLNEPGFADRLRTSGSPTELFERLIKCEKNIVN